MSRLFDARTAGDVRAALAAGDDIEQRDDYFQQTPLISALARGRIDSARALIEAGANINVARADGTTPLHLAVLYGAHDIIRVLIAAGADVDARDFWNDTALFYAKDSTSLTMLLAAGASLKTRGFRRATLIHHFMCRRFWVCALTVIQHGADVSDPWLLFWVLHSCT